MTEELTSGEWRQTRSRMEWVHSVSGSWVLFDRGAKNWVGIPRVGGVTIGSVESETAEGAIAAVEGMLATTPRPATVS
jgi:hypothetical protein